MKFLFEEMHLSMQYTNNSIHSTVITTLDSAEYEVRHMQLPLQKKEAIIKEYSVKCQENQRREMCTTLQML